jgi:glycosyltransferase involved in cell wall biosynthesis
LGPEVDLVCTVYNEGQESMERLLESVVEQERQPDRAIFVDAGSDDGTQEAIRKYSEKREWIDLVVEEGCNIAEGRNIGVEGSDAEIIATTDGGCVLDEEWLKNLLKNFPEADVSAGVFKPLSDGSRFKEVLGVLECPDPEKLPEDWPPSSRSQAFRKEAWEEVGGYPEDLYTAEDTEFNRKLKESGAEYRIARDAFVYWEMRDSLKEVWDQYRLYGKGDAENNTLKGVLTGNYNSRKMLVALGLTGMSFTVLLAVLERLLAVPGLISLVVILLYRFWELDSVDPIDYIELMKINYAMRYGYFVGFARELM